MTFRPKALLAALVLAGLAGAAHADLLEIDVYNDYVGAVQSPTSDGQAALWSVTNATLGDSFLAYCLQLMEEVDQVGSQSYTRVSYAPGADVQELYDRFYSTSLTSAMYAIGFQLALWDVLGQAPASDFTTSVLGARDAALSMLDAVANSTDSYQQGQYEYYAWTSGDHQDVLEVVPNDVNEVPEPNALVLGGMGLLAMGLVTRRRKVWGQR